MSLSSATFSRISGILAAAACVAAASIPGGAAADDGLDVIATTFPVKLITGAVVRDDPAVRLDILLSPELGCPHNYVLTPGDMRRAAGADVIVTNGLGLDDFVHELFKGNNDGTPVIIDSSRGVRGIMHNRNVHEGKHGNGERVHHEGHDHGELNPHIFASPLMAALMAQSIAAQLGEIRPSMAGLYRTNAAAFAARMTVLDADFKVAVGRLKNRGIVTQHGVFDYLARDVGLEIAAVIQAHPGTEPSASEMLELVDEIRHSGAGAVFAEPQYGSKIPVTLAREAGIPMAVLDPVATGPAGAGPDYYEKAMRANIATLEKTLGTR